MKRKVVPAIMLTLLLTGMLALAFNVQPAKASGTIYIRADGSIDPQEAPISTIDNVTYTFTDNINDLIVVERDNIVVDGAGYTVTGSGNGMTLTDRSNVTVRNMTTKNFLWGIVLDSSSNNTLSGNNVTNGDYGILLYGSSDNVLSGNNVTNNGYGIVLAYSSGNNVLSGNNVTANNWAGILLYSSSGNNVFYHNNFINNTQHVYVVTPGFANSWDDGYPSGGNYWSDYNGIDLYSGPQQKETGSDGIGDTPFVIDEDNQDSYPLMKPYPWDPHDVGITRVTTSKNIVGQGFNVSINASVFNYGDSTENINVTIYANSTAIGEINNIELASRNSTTLTFTWNTSGFAKGNYAISAVADAVPGETDTEDNTFIDGWVYVGIPGDINADGIVEMMDFYYTSLAFGSEPGHPNWNPNTDVNDDNIVEMMDFYVLSQHFGQHYP